MVAVFLAVTMLCSFSACNGGEAHRVVAVENADSLPTLSSSGISTLISDSGIIRYKLVAEEWDIFSRTYPSKWVFNKGLYIEKFDEKLHVDASIQADTAYYYDQDRLWELRGRVFVRNLEGTTFRTRVLFWDQNKQEIYSYNNMLVVTPERELRGTEFHSNERMTQYTVSNPKGYFPVGDAENEE